MKYIQVPSLILYNVVERVCHGKGTVYLWYLWRKLLCNGDYIQVPSLIPYNVEEWACHGKGTVYLWRKLLYKRRFINSINNITSDLSPSKIFDIFTRYSFYLFEISHYLLFYVCFSFYKNMGIKKIQEQNKLYLI